MACLLTVMVSPSRAQSDGRVEVWSHLPVAPLEKAATARWVTPVRGELFRMNPEAARDALGAARRAEPGQARELGATFRVPMPDGTTSGFKVVEVPVMAPELAARYPEIKTYAGQGIDDPKATIRLDVTPSGFHAQVFSPSGAVYVDPAYRGDAQIHVSYFKRDLDPGLDFWRCFVADDGPGRPSAIGGAENSASSLAKVQSGASLRTFHIAVAATGEYTDFHGGTVQLGLAAVVTAINRVNQVYESELAVRFQLVANNDLLIYTDGGTDPYTDGDPNAMLDQNQANIDAVIGNANYDIGHVFGQAGGSGLATVGCICVAGQKAEGTTSLDVPTWDAFWIDFVAHEIGHQFGASHTFNSVADFCGSPGQRTADTAYEPGSGSTIMAYAGTCAPDDLQLKSDPYFHAGSLDQIQNTITTQGTCATTTSSGNSAPTVSAGADQVIPASTPFVLTAVATDPDGDALTYCWEEMDLGVAASLTDPDNGSSPLFRSLPPTSTPERYFPNLSSVLANTNWNQEKLPVLSRTMHMRVTVRDQRMGGGGVADDDVQVTVVGTAGPFTVTAPAAGAIWTNRAAATHQVTWNVAGTASAPINAAGVNIYLSTDGGFTFPYLLATNVPNDGLAAVALPLVSTTQARIRVQGAGNVFYAVSPGNFTLLPNGPFPQIAAATLIGESCQPTNGAIDPYETVTVNLTVTNAGTAPTTNLVGTLLASNGIYFPAGTLDYGTIGVGGTAVRSVSFVPVGPCGDAVTGMVRFADGPADLGWLTRQFPLGQVQISSVTQVFANLSSIGIPDYIASPYPSTITVSGVTNPVTRLRVSLNGLTHTWPDDIGIILANPVGQSVALMDSCGGGFGVSGITLRFDDAAASYLPNETTISGGVYKPTNFGPPGSYPSPAPPYPYGDALAPLAAVPNGTWSLFVVDWGQGDTGTLSGGWQLEMIQQVTNYTCCDTLPPVGYTSVAYSNSLVQLSWQSLPGLHYQVQYRTNLAVGTWQDWGIPLPGTGGMLWTNDTVNSGPARFYRIQAVP